MRRGADIIVNIDGDGQFNSPDIAKLVIPLLEDRADFRDPARASPTPRCGRSCPAVKFSRQSRRHQHHQLGFVVEPSSTDVSCGFPRVSIVRAAYRLTLFGRFTYTQETFIDLFSKGLRMVEVPAEGFAGVREHGQKAASRRNLWKYATNSLPIILRAMRDNPADEILRRDQRDPGPAWFHHRRIRHGVVRACPIGCAITTRKAT